jgi:hypothetical protein
VSQPRIHTDFEEFQRGVVEMTALDLTNDIAKISEFHFIVECHALLVELEMIDSDYDVDRHPTVPHDDDRFGFIVDIKENIYKDLYGFYKAYFESFTNQIVSFDDVVDEWIDFYAGW